MGEFFKPWRRKIGIVTLLMACVVMAGWIRSQSTSDSLDYMSSTHRKDSLVSVSSKLVWRRVYPPPHIANLPPESPTIKWNRILLQSPSSTEISLGPARDETKWDYWGIEYAATTLMGARFVLWSISYWYLITPLTLLSAWLLLSKSRTSTLKDSANLMLEKAA